jgi:pyruvate-ferredoxin/flavodoxin oxidoreductase
MAYQKVNAIFSSPERKKPGSGGIFSIFVSDLCKGCAACVTACGDHQALKMVQETEEVNAEHETGTASWICCRTRRRSTWACYNAANPADSKTATLRNMLMVRHNYDALVSGDGACAGCGEKSVLRSIAAVTEAYMRPVYHAKSDRFVAKAGELEKTALPNWPLKAANAAEYALLRQAIAHLIMGLGGEDEDDTKARIAPTKLHGEITDAQLVEAIAAVLLTEAFNHKNLQPIDGRLPTA